MLATHFKNLIVLFFIPLHFFGQTFIATVNNDTIYTDNLYISDDYLEYSNSGEKIEIEIEKIKGYYSEPRNTFYEKKLFNAKKRVGFLNLKLEKQNYFDFVELVFDGKIRAYRSVDYKVDTHKRNYWFFEKKDSLQIAFNADYHKGFMKFDNARYYNLNQDFFKTIFSDDETSLKEIENLKKNGRLIQIRKILNDYNNRHYDKKKSHINTKSMSYVTFLRDSKKELKEDLILKVNNKSFNLSRNSKLKLKISSENNTLICIENSDNKYCRLVSSSLAFPKFYKIVLDKDNQGNIFKINGLSPFYKVRLENYESID